MPSRINSPGIPAMYVLMQGISIAIASIRATGNHFGEASQHEKVRRFQDPARLI